MANIKTLSAWGSVFELKEPLEVHKRDIEGKLTYATTIFNKNIDGITLSTVRHRCAQIVHDEYYTLFVINKYNKGEDIDRRRKMFDEQIKSKINEVPTPRRNND